MHINCCICEPRSLLHPVFEQKQTAHTRLPTGEKKNGSAAVAEMPLWPEFRARIISQRGEEGYRCKCSFEGAAGFLKRVAATTSMRRGRRGRKTRPRSRQRGQGRPARSNLRQSRRRHENPEPTSPSRKREKKRKGNEAAPPRINTTPPGLGRQEREGAAMRMRWSPGAQRAPLAAAA